MTPERWKKIEAIFNAALAFDRKERDDFVRRACGDDAELLEQVNSMLAGDADADSFFEPGVFDLFASSAAENNPPVDENIGRRIGVYRLVATLGAGGMGAVYLAERDDREFRRRVAVKLIRSGIDTHAVHERFLRERQILADLDHPHIARLFDGGTTDDGQPYFVMEYIDGQTILEYCDRHHLPVGERLELFLQICRAVRYAHQKTIVHRDIKPRNILVTGDRTAKLLDFGIAKILGGETGAGTATADTAPAARMLTPDYASPEHLRGLPVGEASDIYSLGIVLYELLTGRHPYRFRRAPSGEIEAVVENNNPEKPSAMIASAAAQRAELEGDLDAIVLKAIDKNPNLRHRSADELIGEIERHLAKKNSSAGATVSLAAGGGRQTAVFSGENAAEHESRPAARRRNPVSPRGRGIRQGAVLLMIGAVGTPIIALVSVGLKSSPAWMLVFAVATILGGLMRLGYAIAFEESAAPDETEAENSRLQVNEKEPPLLPDRHVAPGSWLADSDAAAERDPSATISRRSEPQ